MAGLRWKTEIWCSTNWMLEQDDQPGSPWSVIPWWAKKRSPGLKHHPLPRMGTLLTGVPAALCSCHVVQGEGDDHPKTFLSSAKWASQSNTPCTPLCQDASGVNWQRDIGPGRKGVPGGLCTGPQWSSPVVAGEVHDGAKTGAELAHD